VFATKRENLAFLRQTGIYVPKSAGEYRLYKKPGITLPELGISVEELPELLYIMPNDRLLAVREIQSHLNQRIMRKIQENDGNALRESLREVLEVSFSEPSPESLNGLSDTVSELARQFDNRGSAMRNLALLSNADYNTALHSINVMALTMSYAIFHKLTRQQCQDLGMAALLHDVGKVSISESILQAPRKLTEEEFNEVKKHPLYGYRLLTKCNFRSRAISLASLQHHEKLDGTGYPAGLSDISFAGRLIGIIDCYEAVTSQDRPYRQAANPFNALSMIRDEICNNKFDRRIFEKFLETLSGD
jgi:HD-GYP domain-containing protein (c-di-GMP phosphodiesterase class II)